MKTKVKFLLELDSENEVFAFFPEEKQNDQYWLCYSHVGQHSSCGYIYADSCREASFEAYNDLKIELEGIGYKLDVLNKDFKRQVAISKGKVWTVRHDHDKENNLFEGNKTACINYIKEHKLRRQVAKGTIRLGKVIYEPAQTI